MNSPDNKVFDEYFLKIYQGRWSHLKKALVVPERQILRPNRFAVFKKPVADTCSFLEGCFWKPADFKLEKNAVGLYPYYVMDPASALVARALDTHFDDQVLDMCAAPGGKTLILAEQMSSEKQDVTGSLISNEYSESRRERLTRVLQDYIEKERRMFIHVKGLDGNQYGLRNPNTFDRILADVPCSGERHLFENQKELSMWSIKRTKNLAIRQYSLLSSAWLAVKPQGRIVYSTCSISPEENDQVISKLVKKRNPQILRHEWLNEIDFVEQTEFGYQILPDRAGFGPMYFAIIEKPVS